MNLAPDPDDVLELFLGFWISRAVTAAVQLGGDLALIILPLDLSLRQRFAFAAQFPAGFL